MGRVLGGGLSYGNPNDRMNANGFDSGMMPKPGLMVSSAYQQGRTTDRMKGMTQFPNHRRLAKGRKHKNPKY